MIHPKDLGAPEKFGTFRPQQAAAFDWLIKSQKRFKLLNAPPGVGKSLMAWTYLKLMGARGVITTKTNGLLDQYEKDFEEYGLRDIRGMANYPCRALGNILKCDAGPCLNGEACIYRNAGCAYYDQEAKARESDMAGTNMAYWLSHPPGRETMGERDVLIIDEAHDAPNELAKYAGAEFDAREVDFPQGRKEEDWDWRGWAQRKREQAWSLLQSGTLSPGQARDTRSLLMRFTRLAESGLGWAWEEAMEKRTPKLRFQPIIPSAYAESLLFRGMPHVILMSATIRPHHMSWLGVPEEQFEAYEAPSPFDVRRRPIYWWEIGVRIRGNTSDTNLKFWVSKMDQYIAAGRLQHKGIIHTVSYSRARFIRENSRYGDHMLIHSSEETAGTIERFRKRPAPAILLSPVVDTGWDFPDEQARWQIIAKVPFPDTRTGIAAARARVDNQYVQKEAVQKIQQMVGRVMRGPQDMGETVIIDDSMNYLYSHFRPWFARWFRDAFQPVATPPPMIVL